MYSAKRFRIARRTARHQAIVRQTRGRHGYRVAARPDKVRARQSKEDKMVAQTSQFAVGSAQGPARHQLPSKHSIGQAAFVRLTLRGERRSVSYVYHKGMRSSRAISECTGVPLDTVFKTLKKIRESRFQSTELTLIYACPEDVERAAHREHDDHEELIG